ncbi:MAG: CDP-diacylglycerol--glycerol-3-phosphate 3-phosphatidyltransferase [Candidatus Cloacimonetes bacterium]|jgi:CDP-diacylglycerol--glycerol-3-phosphate 3-phosphatidyltransferase|nr:CDP-diacylglycerol--glycerol-3-phosphate 3-phosphatidyltransferase [Candidatus Cloacimonadota bacterium]NLO43656.1 CDP-diacylglycerol--glycerol-3-phosphate 3-phosphatidyltransferase [Candidatus Cloacimonadota bacterium]
MRKHIPNFLTVLRFILVPVFIYAAFVCESESAAMLSLIIFVVASFTDYLDGTLARKWDVISDFGKIMDPLADKLLVLSALSAICFTEPFNLGWLIFAIILIREVGITLLRDIYHKKGIVVPAGYLGKVKTFMQMVGIIFALGLNALVADISQGLIIGVKLWFWLVVIITLASGFNYIRILILPGGKNES